MLSHVATELFKVKVPLRRNFSNYFFLFFAFSESLSGTYSLVQAVLSSKPGKMFFYGFSGQFFVRHY